MSVVEFIFFGDIAEELVGQPAIMLVSGQHGSSTSVPNKEIAALFGRNYILEATVSRAHSNETTFHSKLLEYIHSLQHWCHHTMTAILREDAPHSSSQLLQQRCPVQQTQLDIAVIQPQDPTVTQKVTSSVLTLLR